MTEQAEGVQTKDEQYELLQGLAKSTSGGDEFTPSTLDNVLDALSAMLQMGEMDKKKRRRRDAENETEERTRKAVERSPEEVRVCVVY